MKLVIERKYNSCIPVLYFQAKNCFCAIAARAKKQNTYKGTGVTVYLLHHRIRETVVTETPWFCAISNGLSRHFAQLCLRKSYIVVNLFCRFWSPYPYVSILLYLVFPCLPGPGRSAPAVYPPHSWRGTSPSARLPTRFHLRTLKNQHLRTLKNQHLRTLKNQHLHSKINT